LPSLVDNECAVNEHPSPIDPESGEGNPPTGSLQSPIRPQNPDSQPSPKRTPLPPPTTGDLTGRITDPKNPGNALDVLRKKMQRIASEYSSGKVNRAQFNAIYARYDEQRTIIERLMSRNPDSNAWQQVAQPGHTSFLRTHFEANCLYYMVFHLDAPTPMMMGGKQQPDMSMIEPVLQTIYTMEKRPETGLARKMVKDGRWLVLALSQHALTLVLYNLEPSMSQINRVRDLHNDFERANRSALERGTRTLEKMVFPQRALVE
jgi:hypothetical protein